MTLTEFLLARIEDDQAAADRWHDLECDRHLVITATDAVMFSQVPGAFCDCNGPSRVLAECTAKRAIIEWAERWIDMDPNCSPIDCDSYEANTVLRLLACTFVDHVDYQDEWRWGTP